jgi:hypothetical protein
VRIVQISDTHLSHFGGVTNENFARLVDFVNDSLRPDLVVNSGDVGILYPDSAEDRELAVKAHAAFEAEVRVLPGNHDVGEAGEHAWMGLKVTSERVANFREAFSGDRFLEIVGSDWAVVGMNSEICSSGLPEEHGSGSGWSARPSSARGAASCSSCTSRSDRRSRASPSTPSRSTRATATACSSSSHRRRASPRSAAGTCTATTTPTRVSCSQSARRRAHSS